MQDAEGALLDQPLCDTLFGLIASGDTKRAATLVRDFKVRVVCARVGAVC